MLPYHGQIRNSTNQSVHVIGCGPAFTTDLVVATLYPLRSAPCQLGSCAVRSGLFDSYHPVPPKSVSALFPPVTVRVADNAASADLNVNGMMRMTTDP